jgi:hypothetical protein
VKGLWYFFGIVVAAGIFAGIAGLGVGYVGGVLWEQVHRYRRVEKLRRKAIADSETADETVSASDAAVVPRLQLVHADAPDLPSIDGRVVHSVQFHAAAIIFDIGGIRVRLSGNPVTVCRGQRFRFPEPGSRDAICSLIGDRVRTVRAPTIERIELVFESGCELVILRNAIAVA